MLGYAVVVSADRDRAESPQADVVPTRRNHVRQRARPRDVLAPNHPSRNLTTSALGAHPVLSPPDVLSLQTSLGNREVARMLHIQRQPSPPAPPLTAAAARNAVTATTRRGLDADSTRFVESLVTATPDGRFTVADAQLVAQTEQGFGATATGEISRAFVDLVLRGTSNPGPPSAVP